MIHFDPRKKYHLVIQLHNENQLIFRATNVTEDDVHISFIDRENKHYVFLRAQVIQAQEVSNQ